MKFIATIHNINNIKELLLLDGFIIGNDNFAARLSNSFSIDEINKLINESKKLKKEVFLTLNKMYLDEEFKLLDAFLTKINITDLTGIIASDLGVIQYLFEKGLNDKIVWHGETLSTNSIDFNFLEEYQIYGAFSAKEITINDIKIISNVKKYPLFITGHGHLNMFYSKRHLITNFIKQYQLEINPNKYTYKILENKRDNNYFPILEDKNGTHVFRANVLNSFKYLNGLEKLVDYFVIDSIFKDDDYTKEVIKLYKYGFNEEKANQLKDKYLENWDDGFYDIKTVYLKEEL